MSRPGDWRCLACNNHNFKFRTECNRCQADKPEGASEEFLKSKARPGDWTCCGCANRNFAFRDICNRCELPRVATLSLFSASLLDDDDDVVNNPAGFRGPLMNADGTPIQTQGRHHKKHPHSKGNRERGPKRSAAEERQRHHNHKHHNTLYRPHHHYQHEHEPPHQPHQHQQHQRPTHVYDPNAPLYEPKLKQPLLQRQEPLLKHQEPVLKQVDEKNSPSQQQQQQPTLPPSIAPLPSSSPPSPEQHQHHHQQQPTHTSTKPEPRMWYCTFCWTPNHSDSSDTCTNCHAVQLKSRHDITSGSNTPTRYSSSFNSQPLDASLLAERFAALKATVVVDGNSSNGDEEESSTQPLGPLSSTAEPFQSKTILPPPCPMPTSASSPTAITTAAPISTITTTTTTTTTTTSSALTRVNVPHLQTSMVSMLSALKENTTVMIPRSDHSLSNTNTPKTTKNPIGAIAKSQSPTTAKHIEVSDSVGTVKPESDSRQSSPTITTASSPSASPPTSRFAFTDPWVQSPKPVPAVKTN